MTSAPADAVWRFGAVEFEPRAARLRVGGGADVALDRQCVAILSALLAAEGEIVSKDRLLELGWPGRVVHENSLAKAVGRLRKLLGPEGDKLKAIYGAGYCLAVHAEQVEAAPPAPARRGSGLTLPFAAGAGLAAAAFGLIFVLVGLRSAPGEDEAALRSSEPRDTVARILWVDDHPENNVQETEAFEAKDIAVYTVTTTEEALTVLSMYPYYDAVISDMGRAGEALAGFKLLEALRARGDDTPFFLYTILTSDTQRATLAEKGGQGAAESRDELYGFILPLVEQKAGEP